jgi:hypothetical protein
VTENNNGYVNGTENSELMRLLEKTTLSLQERTEFEKALVSYELKRILGSSTYTERLRSSLMALISIFLRPMMGDYGRTECAPIERLRGNGSDSRRVACEFTLRAYFDHRMCKPDAMAIVIARWLPAQKAEEFSPFRAD